MVRGLDFAPHLWHSLAHLSQPDLPLHLQLPARPLPHVRQLPHVVSAALPHDLLHVPVGGDEPGAGVSWSQASDGGERSIRVH